MNRRRELIHANCSCSEQRGRRRRRRRRRRRGEEGWPAMAVVWPAWRAAWCQRWWQTVAEAAVFLLLPSASLCCFLPLFFILSVNKVSSLSAVDVWPPSCSQWITGTAAAAAVFFFFSVFLFFLLCSPLFLFFQCFFFCAEAQASSSCSRVLQQGEEGGERLTVALLQTVEREGDRRDWGYCSSLLFWSLFSLLFSFSCLAFFFYSFFLKSVVGFPKIPPPVFVWFLLCSFSLFSPPQIFRLLLSFSKIFATPILLVPPLVFISRGGEDHLTPAMTQGKVGDGSCWQGMVSCFLHHGGMVCVGMGSAGFLGQVGWKERAGKNISKIFISPVSAFYRGEEAVQCYSKTVQFFSLFFFVKKMKMNLGVIQKWVMTMI